MRPDVAACCRAALLAAICFTSKARATDPTAGMTPALEEQRETPSLWRRDWPEFSTLEAVFTVSAGVGTLVLFSLGPVTEPRWRGAVLFDDAVRNSLRAEGQAERDTFRLVGDVTYYAAPVLPFLVDTLLVAYVVKRDDKLTRNLGLVSLEAFAYSGFLSFAATQLTARERPAITHCLENTAGDVESCNLDSRTEAFWSGHTTIAATSARALSRRRR